MRGGREETSDRACAAGVASVIRYLAVRGDLALAKRTEHREQCVLEVCRSHAEIIAPATRRTHSQLRV